MAWSRRPPRRPGWTAPGRSTGRRRDGDHDPGRMQPAFRFHGGSHARASGQAVVDEDDGPAGGPRHRPVPAIGLFQPQQLLALTLNHPLDHVRRDAQAAHDVVVDHHDSSARDRAHRHLFVARDAELAYQEDIEGSAEGHRDFVRHRHTARRQPQNDHVGMTPVAFEKSGQGPTGVPPVVEHTLGHPSPLMPADRVVLPRTRHALNGQRMASSSPCRWATAISMP